MIPNCNRCNVRMRCRGESNMEKMNKCKKFIPPYDKFKLAEIALAHPTSLNEALSVLPFETNISNYIKVGSHGY